MDQIPLQPQRSFNAVRIVEALLVAVLTAACVTVVHKALVVPELAAEVRTEIRALQRDIDRMYHALHMVNQRLDRSNYPIIPSPVPGPIGMLVPKSPLPLPPPVPTYSAQTAIDRRIDLEVISADLVLDVVHHT